MSTPDTIILDLSKAVRALHKRVENESIESDGYLTAVIEDVVQCLSQESSAISCLTTYAEAQRYRRAKEGTALEAQNIAWDIVEFGRDIYDQLKSFGVYRQGDLPYVFTGRCRTDNVILTRIVTATASGF
jgi:hypothetical protein